MSNPKTHSLGEGVYYASDDYAGFVQRLLVIVIDSLALWGLFAVTVQMQSSSQPRVFGQDPTIVSWFGFFFLAWTYMAVLKPSRIRTIGYRLTGLKVVNLRGERPSVFRMTFRLLLWVFGPFNILFDLFWQGADDARQSLRDCFSGTYVVRTGAKPAGSGPQHLARFFSGGMTLVYPRVQKSKA